MQATRCAVIATVVVGWVVFAAPPPCRAQGLFHRLRTAHAAPPAGIPASELGRLIDELDESLFEEGVIAVKSPDVWGQNRMTKYRVEYEKDMAAQVGQFTLKMNAALRRADAAVFTSATALGAAIPPPARRAAGGRQAAASESAAAASLAGAEAAEAARDAGPSVTITNSNTMNSGGGSGGGGGGGSGGGGEEVAVPTPGALTSGLLQPISDRLDKLTESFLQFPENMDWGGAFGLEPTIELDERSRYNLHLQQLRRINTGDDLTDAPGYGLYLVRIPVSLLPGPEVRKGYGASVTVEAKHVLSSDLLPNTFRDVVIMDAAYQINPILLKMLHGVKLTPRSSSSRASEASPDQPGDPSDGQPQAMAAPNAMNAGHSSGVAPSVPMSESPRIYGEELQILVESLQLDQEDWYRHDPSVLTWLINELGSAHRFMREQARNGAMADLFAPHRYQELDLLLQGRSYAKLDQWRWRFLRELVARRGGFQSAYPPGSAEYEAALQAWPAEDDKTVTDVLVYALMVQSVLADRQMKHDMDIVAQQKGCACADLNALTFYDLFPTAEARQAFNDYVACKWPIHVFALDPAVDQQNQLDLFSARSEMQMAVAVALSTGRINFDQAMSYARRLETDIQTVGLNRTAVGFGAGESTFGWRFYPRIQTPPTPGNLRRIAGLVGGTSYNQNYVSRNRAIEPGPRECVALVVAPNFVPALHFTSSANWFEHTGAHADQRFDTQDVLEFSRKVQTAKSALAMVCDSPMYRPGELARLSDRITQLEAKLPLQDYRVPLPFEGDLTGSEIFSSTGARLAPRLLTWYGEPAQQGQPSTIFLLGTNFSVHETQVVAGGLAVGDDHVRLMSRNVMQITISPEARPVRTKDGRLVFDVHVAGPNGISNHLFVEADAAAGPAVASPSFGYGVTTGELEVTYRVVGRVDGDPSSPGTAVAGQTAPRKLVLSWLEPVGLAPQTVDLTFLFPGLAPIEVVGLHPDADGQIVYELGDQQFAQAILDRLQATAVTFDPVRNPRPLGPMTTTGILVTPKTGTHAEQPVTASGSLTVSFVPLAFPAGAGSGQLGPAMTAPVMVPAPAPEGQAGPFAAPPAPAPPVPPQPAVPSNSSPGMPRTPDAGIPPAGAPVPASTDAELPPAISEIPEPVIRPARRPGPANAGVMPRLPVAARAAEGRTAKEARGRPN